MMRFAIGIAIFFVIAAAPAKALAVDGAIAGLQNAVSSLKSATDELKKGMDILRGDVNALRSELETVTGLEDLGKLYDDSQRLAAESRRLSGGVLYDTILPDLTAIMGDLPLCGHGDITLRDLAYAREDVQRQVDRGELTPEEASRVLDSIDHTLGQAAGCTADVAIRPENAPIIEEAYLDREARLLGVDPSESCDLCLEARRRAAQRTQALYLAQRARQDGLNAAAELEALEVKPELPALRAISQRQLERNLQEADALSADLTASDIAAGRTDRTLRDLQIETVERGQGKIIVYEDDPTVDMGFVAPDEGGNGD